MTSVYDLVTNEITNADFTNFNFSEFYYKQILDTILRNTSIKFFNFENTNIDDLKLRQLVRILVLRNAPIAELNLNKTKITLGAFETLKQLIKLIKIKKIMLTTFASELMHKNLIHDFYHMALAKRVLINFI